jgi:hypothetical protein
LRHWVIEDGLWIDRRRRLPSVHQPRYTLLAFIDDARSRLMALRFVKDESTFDYFRITRTYLEVWCKPGGYLWCG